MSVRRIANPFRPGAGHMPMYLAGRATEVKEFKKLLDQGVILENLILTGLRGTGKTVLLDTLKPIAMNAKWYWVGSDLSESASVSEDRIATRLLVDLAAISSSIDINVGTTTKLGFGAEQKTTSTKLDYGVLRLVFDQTPGLVSDKLKYVLELVWSFMNNSSTSGVVFAYDEAQNLSDRHAAKNEYPLSLLLDVFQSIQKKGIPFMLALSGLPTLFPNLVESRTFAERMFHVLTLDRLNEKDSRDAILKPIAESKCGLTLFNHEISNMFKYSGGYPYFIQFLGREAFDLAIPQHEKGRHITKIPFDAIMRKLDIDFYSGRWSKATDRQRALLSVIARLESRNGEFTVQQISERSKQLLPKPFSPSHANQILTKLIEAGLIYKNRHGKYAYAVPLLGDFVLRLERREGVPE